MSKDELIKNREDVAIIGMAGRFPGSRNIDEFWMNLKNGIESIRPFTIEELKASGIDENIIKDPSFVNAGAVMDDADCFDASFFGINPREAEIMDPQHRVFLECAWEAFENAGYNPEDFKGHIGVFGGVGQNTYFQKNLITRPDLLEMAGHYPVMIGTEKEYAITRVSFKLNLKGPAISVNTACSTSAVAIHIACQSVLSGECDMAIAGGARIKVPLKAGYLYQEDSIPSPDGHCRAFDAEARGTVLGSGVGIIVLKRLSDAIQDGDCIYAVIRGSAINNDGSLKTGFTAPSVQGQANVIADALAMADVSPDTIGYVEAHGTGTTLGDPIEIAGLTRAFRNWTNSSGYCPIGSVKTNIGHLDAGAGVAGVIKTVLAMKYKQIPPSLNFNKPNPQIDFSNSPFFVNTKLREWKREDSPRRAGISSFGLGGTNAHIVLEEAPEIYPSGPSRPRQLLLLSAKSHTALDRATENLSKYLNNNRDINLADVSYTLQTGRKGFDYRRFVVCSDPADAASALESIKPKRNRTHQLGSRKPEIVFMFSGQGSQYVNMGLNLYEHESLFRESVDQCSEILKDFLGKDLRELLYPDADESGKAAALLNETCFTQPALFTIEYALAQLWISWGVLPQALVGHSIGEYVAASIAGVFSLKNALMLVARRGRLMQDLEHGSMLSVRMPASDIEKMIKPELSIAAINSPLLCVVSGPKEAVTSFQDELKKENLICRLLKTSHAFHSPMMDSIIEPFKEIVKDLETAEPNIPFVSTVTGTWITPEQATDPVYWANQLRKTVLFSNAVKTLWEESDRVLLEVGPGTALTTLAMQQSTDIEKHIAIPSLGNTSSDHSEWTAILSAIGQLWLYAIQVDWNTFYTREKRHRVPLPTYPFERKRFWIEPVKYEVVIGEKEESLKQYQQNIEDKPEELKVTIPGNRKEQIINVLKDILKDASGMDLTNMDDFTSFLDMGFESLFLTQWTLLLKKRLSIQISIGQLFGELSTFSSLAEYVENELSSADEHHMPPIIEDSQTEKSPAMSTFHHIIEKIPRSGNIPLSLWQQRLWYSDQLEPNSAVYNLPSAIRFIGRLDKAAFEESLNEIIRRHESLRTIFRIIEDTPVQVITPSLALNLPLIDLSSFTDKERDEHLSIFLKTEAARPFKLSEGPLARASLIKLKEDEFVLFFMPHHIVFDGWSFGIFRSELFSLYDSFVNGKPSPLKDLPIQYADFAVWQRQWNEGGNIRQQEYYWYKQLSGNIPVLQLPTDYPRPPVRSSRGARESIKISNQMIESLSTLGKKEGATLFMVILAAVKTLLYRYTGEEDICVGSPISGRTNPTTENLIGFFVNTIVLRTNLQGTPSFNELLSRVRKVCLDAYNNQEVVFDQLIQKLSIKRDLSTTPLYQVLFAFQHEMDRSLMISDISWSPVEIDTYVAQTDLSFWIRKTESGFDIILEYSTELFDACTVRGMLNNLEVLLAGIATNPYACISRIPLLSDCEIQKQLDCNSTDFEYSRDTCVHLLFEEQVEKTPDKVAVVYKESQLTYSELNQRANKLAGRLNKLGVGQESLVGIFAERSLEMVISILGVLKAGGAYVPLDPAFPKDRLAFMIDDIKMPVLLTQKRLQNKLPDTSNCKIEFIDDIDNYREKNDNIGLDVSSDNLVYVIYTSGSTGKPKGVQITHRSLINFLTSMQKEPGLDEKDIILSVTTFSFDIFGLELFLPLITGACSIIIDQQTASNGVDLKKSLKDSKATVMQATPATWRLMLEGGWENAKGLKVLCGGEALTRDLANKIMDTGAELWNMYGPTETTIWSSVCRVEREDREPHIGHPIANTQFYILDSNLNMVPVGVPGELYIGGEGLARGYHNRDELTKERFIPNPFDSKLGSLFYKTGDIVRRRGDGTLEYLGRLDHQVKIRGMRIEPGEIEELLNQHPSVQETIVIAREDIPGDKRLVAYVVAKTGQTPGQKELREFLSKTLPAYMLPSSFVLIDRFPLNQNGKKNRNALPRPDSISMEREIDYVAPRDQLEQKIEGIWKRLLGVKSVSIKEDFFELGGHSLLAARLFAQIEKELGKNIPLATLFQASTIEKLANILREKGWSPQWSPLVSIKTSGVKPPLFLVHGAEGNVLLYRTLSNYLGDDQPIYGLQSEGLNGNKDFNPRFETMAAQYINEIKTIQPEGPYYLGGYCLGGAIAFEMARQLNAQNQKVGLLVLIETYNIHSNINNRPKFYRFGNKMLNVIFHLGNTLTLNKGDMFNFIKQKTKVEGSRYNIQINLVISKISQKLGFNNGFSYHHVRVDKANDRAHKEYIPKYYSGRVTLFLPKLNFIGFSDPYYGWKELVGGEIETHRLPVYSRGMLVEPFVQHTAEILKSCIERALKDEPPPE